MARKRHLQGFFDENEIEIKQKGIVERRIIKYNVYCRYNNTEDSAV